MARPSPGDGGQLPEASDLEALFNRLSLSELQALLSQRGIETELSSKAEAVMTLAKITPTEATGFRPEVAGSGPIVPAFELEERRRLAERTVCLIQGTHANGGQWSGTGFLVTWNGRPCIMTNHHVLDSVEASSRASVFFDYLHQGTLGSFDVPRAELAADLFFQTNIQLDCTVVALKGHTIRQGLSLDIPHPIPFVDGVIQIYQHPAGRERQHSMQIVREVSDLFIRYRADTYPGSSGSPVFDHTMRLVGIHHGGFAALRENEGIRIDRIIAWLQTSSPLASPSTPKVSSIIKPSATSAPVCNVTVLAAYLSQAPSPPSLPAIPAPAPTWQKLFTFGTTNELDCPRSVATRPGSGEVAVAGCNNHCVKVFAANGQFIRNVGTHGSGDGQYSHPLGVAFESGGNIVVADSGNNRIQVFSIEGRFLRKFGQGQLKRPQALAHDRSNNCYVTDDSNKVHVFRPDGVHFLSFGGPGSGDGQFNGKGMAGICVDPTNGHIVVTDFDNARVQIFQPDGKFVRKFGSKGSSEAQLLGPWGVAVTEAGNIFVCEQAPNCRIQLFSPEGLFMQKFELERGTCPSGITLDSIGRVLICQTVAKGYIQVVGNANPPGVTSTPPVTPPAQRHAVPKPKPADASAALLSAIQQKDLVKVRQLVESGIDLNVPVKVGEDWLSPLTVATYTDEAIMVCLLETKRVNVNLVGNHGWAPLYKAAMIKSPSRVRLLLEAGADPNVRGWWGDTPLHLVCADEKGKSADELAQIARLKAEIVRLLLAYGADPNLAVPADRHRPLPKQMTTNSEILALLASPPKSPVARSGTPTQPAALSTVSQDQGIGNRCFTERLIAEVVVSGPPIQQDAGNGAPRLRVPIQPHEHLGDGIGRRPDDPNLRVVVRNPKTSCEMTIFGVNHVVWKEAQSFFPFDVATLEERSRFGGQLLSCFKAAFPPGAALQLLYQEPTSGDIASSLAAVTLQERVVREVIVDANPTVNSSVVFRLRALPADTTPIAGKRVFLRAAGRSWGPDVIVSSVAFVGQTMIAQLPPASPTAWVQSLAAYCGILFPGGTVVHVIAQVNQA